jgi:hypothetical protein
MKNAASQEQPTVKTPREAFSPRKETARSTPGDDIYNLVMSHILQITALTNAQRLDSPNKNIESVYESFHAAISRIHSRQLRD